MNIDLPAFGDRLAEVDAQIIKGAKVLQWIAVLVAVSALVGAVGSAIDGDWWKVIPFVTVIGLCGCLRRALKSVISAREEIVTLRRMVDDAHDLVHKAHELTRVQNDRIALMQEHRRD